MTTTTLPAFADETARRILAVSEDRLTGFQVDPFGEIARQSGVEVETVIETVRALLEAGVIRRVRQTLLANRLASGALVAWEVPVERLDSAFDFMFQGDPFTGHVVVRTTDRAGAGASFRLWTTLKVPPGFSVSRHAEYLAGRTGAARFHLMPARRLYTLGVGHVRRREIEPGSRTAQPGAVVEAEPVTLSDREWRVVTALKREFEPGELGRDLWSARAEEAGLSLGEFVDVARSLDDRGLVGRFSTFLEHVKPDANGHRVTRYNALFHWRVPPGCEDAAGREVGRHHIMTHAYWREGGPAFLDVNVMGVAHGTDKVVVLAHKAAIDAHLVEAGIEVLYTNVFWGGRSEIKPSEISPIEYERWLQQSGIDPETMREA